MSLVVDSSMTLAWYFEDEKTDDSTAVLHRVVEAGAVVPALWRLDVANGLQVAVRRGRIDLAYRDASLNDLRSLPIAIDPGTNRQAWSATLRRLWHNKGELCDCPSLFRERSRSDKRRVTRC